MVPTLRHKFNTSIYIKRRTEKNCRSMCLNCHDCSQRYDDVQVCVDKIVFTMLLSNFYFLGCLANYIVGPSMTNSVTNS
jgi:hypothetical protein